MRVIIMSVIGVLIFPFWISSVMDFSSALSMYGEPYSILNLIIGIMEGVLAWLLVMNFLTGLSCFYRYEGDEWDLIIFFVCALVGVFGSIGLAVVLKAYNPEGAEVEVGFLGAVFITSCICLIAYICKEKREERDRIAADSPTQEEDEADLAERIASTRGYTEFRLNDLKEKYAEYKVSSDITSLTTQFEAYSKSVLDNASELLSQADTFADRKMIKGYLSQYMDKIEDHILTMNQALEG